MPSKLSNAISAASRAGQRGDRSYARYFSVSDETLYFVDPPAEAKIPLTSVLVIGEETTEAGPYLDDYFLCLVVSGDGRFYRLPIDAEGSDVVARVLDQRFGPGLEWKLGSSTSRQSRVLWPAELRDRRMFAYAQPTPQRWPERFLRILRLWPWTYSQTLSPEVMEYLRTEERTNRRS